MNMLEAARDTMKLVHSISGGRLPPDKSLSTDHLSAMLSVMEEGEFSEGKMGRWLGWMQASAVAMHAPLITLEDMKNINRKWAD